MKTRIAPSPTGDPHVGTAYQALFNYVFAHQHGGSFVVRIEDTDRARYNAGSQQRILEMLDWLGLAPDESPVVGGPSAPYIQTERAAIHRAYADELIARGHAYRAFDTAAELDARRKIAEANKSAFRGYDRRDRSLSNSEAEARAAAGEPFVVRLKAPTEGNVVVNDRLRGPVVFASSEIDDKVLLKADGLPTYHLAAMSDDHDMGITHVIRAEEWLTSTPIHVLIFQAMEWQQPEWIHTPWLLNADKSKLSKRKGDVSVESYREKGILPEALLNFLGMMGWTMPDGREVFSVKDMIEHFSWERVSLGGSVFDWGKLSWLNGKYIREVLALDDLTARVTPFLAKAGFDVSDTAFITGIVALMRERFNLLSEVPEKVGFFFAPVAADDKAAAKLGEGQSLLTALTAQLEALPDWNQVALEACCREFATNQAVKLGAVMQPVRAALTGRLESPGLFEIMLLLGKAETLQRLATATTGPTA
jgi:glutamyl-tRNA synthetase